MWRLAGNTAASSAISHSPETRRVEGTSTPSPPATSATPLTATIVSASAQRAVHGGTIWR